jgi:hypothetical protein
VLEIAPGTALEMDSYPGALGQIFTNLLSNALLHALTVARRPHPVTTQAGPGWVEIRFDDDGNGIPAANLHASSTPSSPPASAKAAASACTSYNLATRTSGGQMEVDSTRPAAASPCPALHGPGRRRPRNAMASPGKTAPAQFRGRRADNLTRPAGQAHASPTGAPMAIAIVDDTLNLTLIQALVRKLTRPAPRSCASPRRSKACGAKATSPT